MALGGGKFSDFNKIVNGVYSRFRTVGQPYIETIRGVVAGGLVLDWAPDDELFVIEKSDFEGDPVAVTGYSYNDPKNLALREIFRHAIRLYGYRLNSTGGEKARAVGVGEAKNTGVVGNNITVSVLKNVIDPSKYDITTYYNGIEKDNVTVDGKVEKTLEALKGRESKETLSAPDVEITQEEATVTVAYENLVESYDETSTKVTKDGAAARDVTVETKGLTDTVNLEDAVDGTYKIEATVSGKDEKTLGSMEVTKTTTPETLKLTKGAEDAGETIDSESVSVEVSGLQATVTYASLPEEYTQLKTQVKKDGVVTMSKVSVSNAELVDTVTFEADAPKGEYLIEARLGQAEGEDVKVIKTFHVTVETDQAEKVDYSNSGAQDGATIAAPTVNFDFKDKTLTVSASDTYVEYPGLDIEVTFGGEPATTGFKSSGGKVTFNEEAQSGDYTVTAYLKRSSSQKKLMGAVVVTVTVDETGLSGADGSKIDPNKFVVFEDGIIEENVGYVFGGGVSGHIVTVADHNNFLNKLEGRSYNYLFYDGKDDTVKAVYDEYTRRMRDGRGLYTQTVLDNYLQADYEGIISVYNDVFNVDTVNTLTPWLAGLLSALELDQEATNTLYDGELQINSDISQSRMEVLAQTGHFFFHETDIGEVSTYEDINTFRSYTEDKNDEVTNNKTIRIVDYIHNSISRISNRLDIGKLKNNEDGRNVLWARVDKILTELHDLGAIEEYTPQDIQVLEIEGQKNAVEIRLNITIIGTVRKIYITTTIIK